MSHQRHFTPRRWVRHGDLQTLVGNFLKRGAEPPESEAVYIQTEPETQVLCQCNWQPAAAEAPLAILLHGLEGSSASQYMRGNAAKLWDAGWSVIRMNMRNCGGTENLTPTLYHSGLSVDMLEVMRWAIRTHGVRSISLIGYSMGGNIVLKLAGELGSSMPELAGVVGVSPAMDLGPSADKLHEGRNRVYEWKFLRGLLARYQRKCELFPKIYDPARVKNIRSIRDFDERITGPYSGFTGADDYYHRAAAARVLDRIAVPTLILHAADDPFIRVTRQTRSVMAANPHLTFVETAHGGHCAFLADRTASYDGYWAEHTTLAFLTGHVRVPAPVPQEAHAG
ncbi:YheT family hydrolase [Terriglobus tenax]|uniref:YheT family hydrolase n=1 Tax=Terriglobus tenax TaxID=1111115 RepID=UPI0021E0E77A|nr:alpha/beta fold hydrolase [Terriglobus tenax]